MVTRCRLYTIMVYASQLGLSESGRVRVGLYERPDPDITSLDFYTRVGLEYILNAPATVIDPNTVEILTIGQAV